MRWCVNAPMSALPRAVVLSLEVCDDLDSTAIEALGEFVGSLKQKGVKVLLARVKDRPREALLRSGLAETAQGGVAMFWSVDDAVNAIAAP